MCRKTTEVGKTGVSVQAIQYRLIKRISGGIFRTFWALYLYVFFAPFRTFSQKGANWNCWFNTKGGGGRLEPSFLFSKASLEVQLPLFWSTFSVQPYQKLNSKIDLPYYICISQKPSNCGDYKNCMYCEFYNAFFQKIIEFFINNRKYIWNL